MSYHGYEGIALDLDERDRLVHDLGPNRAMILRNHGLLVGGRTVPEAWSDLYYLERACRTLLLAHASGQPLRVLAHDIAEKTALAWEQEGAQAAEHFEQMKALLDAQDPSYRD